MTDAELTQALAENAEMLANVTRDLDAMPSFKRGSKWHLDRAAARQDLLARRERLRDQRRQLVEMN
jgi:hypothetical protein